MSLIEKLNKVQQELRAPKGQMNSFGGYKYRSCEDILEAVKPLCKENGLVVNLSDKITMIGDRYYVEAIASVLIDKEGEKDAHSVRAYAREAQSKKGMDEAQITGAASSYARKYALNGLFAIDDTKDPDATNKHESSTKTSLSGQTSASMPQDLGEYTIPIGKNKGRKLKELPEKDLKGFIDWVDKGKITGKAKEVSDIMFEYING